MLFDGNVVRSEYSVILSHMEPLLIISGHYDVISKKLKKLLILRFLIYECFFRDKNVLIVVRITFASKWFVTWPCYHYELENDRFDHPIRNFIVTSGEMISGSRNKYFRNQCNKCISLSYNFPILFPFFLLRILKIRDEKMLLPITRDSSTNKQQRQMWSLSASTLSDKRVQNQNSNHNFSNETRKSNFYLMSISWPSDRVLWESMHVIHAFLHRNARILIKTNFFRTGWQWDSEKVFWLPSLKGVLMTSRTWITIQLPKN